MNAVPRRLLVSLASVLAVLAALAPAVSANTESIIADSPVPPAGEPTVNSGWQAGTCTKDTPTCSVATPEQFFENAAGHPQVGFTQFIVRHKKGTLGEEEPIGGLKEVRVDLPVGLSVNPQATPQCPQATFEASASSCEGLGAKVGESFVTGSILGMPSPTPITADVYNIVPPSGEPARFGFNLAGNNIYLKADVDTAGNYHEGFTIDVPPLPLGIENLILKNRLVFNGRAGDGTFITTPSTCYDPEKPPHEHVYSTYLLASSIKEEEQPGYDFPADAAPAIESPLPKGKKPIDCAHVPYNPGVDVGPGTAQTDSPAGATTEVTVPHILGGEKRDSSNTEEAQVALPQEVGLNPSAANGLVACTDAQFGKGTTKAVACPPASKVGTVEIETPPLPSSDGILKGDVFVGTQQSRDPASGDEYRIFVDAESPRYGLSVRLVGRVSANPATGQLTTRFQELPQVPFSAFVLKLDGGPHATLTSPTICGPHKTVATMTPWTGNPPATPSGQFTLKSAPGGGPCAKALAERPFAPSFAASASSSQAAGFTNLGIDVARSDGNQELKGVEVTLPPGMTAKLAGLRYCPEAAIAAAATNSGAAEAAAPSCPADSLVGSAAITSGSGSDPLHIDSGKAYLAGPYKGAPLSLAVITPATAGPFDLGTVVVRVALFVDSKTAQVRTVTDPLPHVYGGTLLDLRSVSVKIDRPGFTLNGTNCAPSSFAAVLHGGGANPADPAAFSSLPASAPYAASGCEALPFGPKLFLRAFGATKRARNPKLRAILVARPGDANISRAAVTLPKSIILDQGAIGKVCTRVQFSAGQCPSNSVYGFAEADSPLLDGPLKGPVYLRSSSNPLPDLVAALHGQVDIELDGRTDSIHGRIRNTFDTVPDVPVSRFVLTIRGGKKKGLLINSQNLCAHRQFAKLDLTAQNGKRLTKKKLKFRTPCKKHKRPKKHRGGKGTA
jgi:hypothetical protein